MPSPDRDKRRWPLQLGGVIVLVLVMLAMATNLPLVPQSDEAYYLMRIHLVMAGKLPYRDFFEFLFPLGIYIGALYFKLTGGLSIVTGRVLVYLLCLSALWATREMGRAFLKPWSERLFVFFALVGIILNCYILTHHAISAPLSVLAVYAIFRFLKIRRHLWLILSGLLCALALGTTQSRGILLFPALFAFLTWHFRQDDRTWLKAAGAVTQWFAAPFLAVVALMMLWLGWHGLLPEFFLQSIGWIAGGHYSAANTHLYFSSGLPEIVNLLFETAGNHITGFTPIRLPFALMIFSLGFLPILGMLWALQQLIRHRHALTGKTSASKQTETLLLLLTGSIALTLSTLSYSTAFLIAISGWLGYLLAAMAIQSLMTVYFPRWFKIASTAIVACGLLGLLMLKILSFAALGMAAENWIPSYGTRDGWLLSEHGPMISRAKTNLIHTIRDQVSEKETFFVFNSSPELYLMADRQPTIGYFIVLPFYTTAAQLQAIEQAILRHRPPLVIYDSHDINLMQRDHRFVQYRHNPPRLDSLHRLLREHYVEAALGPYAVYFSLEKFEQLRRSGLPAAE